MISITMTFNSYNKVRTRIILFISSGYFTFFALTQKIFWSYIKKFYYTKILNFYQDCIHINLLFWCIIKFNHLNYLHIISHCMQYLMVLSTNQMRLVNKYSLVKIYSIFKIWIKTMNVNVKKITRNLIFIVISMNLKVFLSWYFSKY